MRLGSIVTPLGPSKSGRPSGAKAVKPTQHVFVHVRHDSEEVLSFCKRATPQVKRVPHEVRVSEEPCWQKELELTIHSLPKPYVNFSWDHFWHDVHGILTASLESRECATGYNSKCNDRYEVKTWLWPSTFVTDSKELCMALSDPYLKGVLADAVRIQATEVLPVILWSHFKQICGGLLHDDPLGSYDPFAEFEFSGEQVVPLEVRTINLCLGLYIQKPGDRHGDSQFGCRTFLLCSNGLCAYTAVSCDGIRSVECGGNWDVINGMLVIGSGARKAAERHMDLASEQGNHEMPLDKYEEPIQIRLEDVEDHFLPAQTVSEILPCLSSIMKSKLVEQRWLQKFETLAQNASTSPENRAEPGAKVTCPVRPGHYVHKCLQTDRSITMVLHVTGACEYHETSSTDSLKDLGSARWTVDASTGLLVVASKDQDAFGFSWTRAKQQRTAEQQVKRVQFPIHFLETHFTFKCFPQDEDPFRGHCLTDPKMCLGGVLDPLSCMLRSVPLKEDVMPIHDFEKELHGMGVRIEDVVSDLSLLDRDADGNLSCDELIALADFGKSRSEAALEDLHTLRQGLLEIFEGLEGAFKNLAGSLQGRSSRWDFTNWMAKMSHKDTPFHQWVTNLSADDVSALFESLDIDRDGCLNWADFESLHLCSALLALRQVDHFCRFLQQAFKGSPEDTYRRSFMAIDVKGKKSLTESEFLKGVYGQLGYRYEKAAKSVWNLVDRNFDHKVNMEDFMSLKNYTSKNVLSGLEDLRVRVLNKCGSLKRCYDKMLDEEKRVRGSSATDVKFETFESVCKQLGIRAKLDLRTLFLFLDEVTGDHGSDYLTRKEWMLLQGFEARSVTGHPTKLRKTLKAKFGTLEKAFHRIHAAWLPHELQFRLERLTIERTIDSYILAEKDSRGLGTRQKEAPLGALGGKFGMLSGTSGGNLIVSSWEPPVRRVRDFTVASHQPIPRYKLPGIVYKPSDFRRWTPQSDVANPKSSSAVNWGFRTCNAVVPSYAGRR